jgi:hypothetical protein
MGLGAADQVEVVIRVVLTRIDEAIASRLFCLCRMVLLVVAIAGGATVIEV